MQIRKFETLDEIRCLDGYIERLSGVESQEPKFLGYYQFRDFIHCARSECNREHGFGYVLETVNGHVIGIGNKCGANMFGKIWDAARPSYNKQIDRYQKLQALTETLRELPSRLALIESLLYGPQGAAWHEKAEQSLIKLCSQQVLDQLYLRASRRDADILHARIRTEDDVQLGFRRDSDFAFDLIAQFSGLGALVKPSPREILMERLRDPLKPFLSMTADSLIANPSNHRHFNRLYRGMSEHVQSAERRLAEAPLFFTTENLRLLAHLAKNQNDRMRMEQLVWNDSTGLVEIRRSGRPGPHP